MRLTADTEPHSLMLFANLRLFLTPMLDPSSDLFTGHLDPGYSHFGKAVNVAETQLGLITSAQAKELRILEHDRDTATHDTLDLSEDLLYYTAHGAVNIAMKLGSAHSTKI